MFPPPIASARHENRKVRFNERRRSGGEGSVILVDDYSGLGNEEQR